MTYRTAIIPCDLPSDPSPTEDEDGYTEVYVHLGAGYARLLRVDNSTYTRFSVVPGPIEDHIDNFTLIE